MCWVSGTFRTWLWRWNHQYLFLGLKQRYECGECGGGGLESVNYIIQYNHSIAMKVPCISWGCSDEKVRSLLLEQGGILSLWSGTGAGELCLLAQSKRCCRLAYHWITQRSISIDGRTWLFFLKAVTGMLLLENGNGLQRACLSMCRLEQCRLVGNGSYHLSNGSTVVSGQTLETEGLFPEQ